jgi:hypothetical protein
MGVFNVGGRYHRELDVRAYGDLLALLNGPRPNGILWPLLASRRAGKTWTLAALEEKLGVTVARFLDLRYDGAVFDADPPPTSCLLLDEPGPRLMDSAAEFIARCTHLHAQGIKILLALSPGEWTLLAKADRAANKINLKDLRYLPRLAPAEANQLARRCPEAWPAHLLGQLPEPWQRHPYLLELVLETAERNPELRADMPELLRVAIDESSTVRHKYVEFVFTEGLTKRQQKIVRSVARARPVVDEQSEFLWQCGLLMKHGPEIRLVDPILADYLPPPLRIHHISDIHVGDKEARDGDIKVKGPFGMRLGPGAGAGRLVRDLYLDHVHALPAKPHLVIVSGDIAERGDPALYGQLTQWFATLKGLLAPHPHLDDKSSRILIVGGNHDVDWGHVLGEEGARLRHQPFAKAFSDYFRPRLEDPPEKRPPVHVKYPDLGVAFLLLGSAEFGGEMEEYPERQRLLDYINELRQQAVDAEKAKDLGKAAELLDRVARIDPGLIHHKDLQSAREHSWRLPVRIAVLHHPVSPLPATEIAHFAGLINAGQVKDMLFAKRFCLVLHGHMHTGWFACEQWPGQHGDWCLRIAAAASLGSREVAEHHGFNDIEIVREGDQYEIVVRRFIREGATWTENAVMGPFVPGASVTSPKPAGSLA